MVSYRGRRPTRESLSGCEDPKRHGSRPRKADLEHTAASCPAALNDQQRSMTRLAFAKASNELAVFLLAELRRIQYCNEANTANDIADEHWKHKPMPD